MHLILVKCIIHNNSPAGTVDSTSGFTPASAVADWYDAQTLQLDNATINWKSIAQKPVQTSMLLIEVLKRCNAHCYC